MIDLHCHILPGVDDGSSSMEESLEMARIMAEQGFDTLAPSPHYGEGPGGDVSIEESAVHSHSERERVWYSRAQSFLRGR